MTKEEREELEQEHENLKILAKFHLTYEVIESLPEREKMINDILDRMNEIKEKLENE